MQNIQTSRFRRTFTNKHTVLPVIHVRSADQALMNAERAANAGVDGVFLIDHAVSSEELLEVHAKVVERFPDLWAGVNCLDLGVRAFERVGSGVPGIWVDKGSQVELTEASPLYFGGTAFKGTGTSGLMGEKLAEEARRAAAFMDVVTTSGPRTGYEPTVEKIRVMREALADFPLAVASGMTPENVSAYLPYADCFLVATGINDRDDDIDPHKLRDFMSVLRNGA